MTNPAPEAVMRKMLSSLEADSYDDFVADADDDMKAAVTREMFEDVSAQVGPRLQRGYNAHLLGYLHQGGHDVRLWKLDFSDGADDHLVKMSMRDGLVSGFLIQ